MGRNAIASSRSEPIAGPRLHSPRGTALSEINFASEVFVPPRGGERIELCVLRSAHEARTAGIEGLLGHKGEPYLRHLQDFFGSDCNGTQDGLEWRFYAAFRHGVPVGVACVWSAFGVGILGHVYTVPEARGLGIARQVLSLACQDFDKSGGSRLYLNTDAGSFQERLYAGLGFWPVGQIPGAMRRGGAQRVTSCPIGGKGRIVRFTWAHWPGLNEFLLRGEVRSRRWEAADSMLPCSAEYAVLRAWYGGSEGPPTMAVLVDSADAVHGFACQARPGGRIEVFTPDRLCCVRESLEKAVVAYSKS